jgi:hypothetical protein
MRRAQNKKHAKELQKQLVKQLASAEPGQRRTELGAQKLTFAKVAAAYETARPVPAVYSGDIKIRGDFQQPSPIRDGKIMGPKMMKGAITFFIAGLAGSVTLIATLFIKAPTKSE